MSSASTKLTLSIDKEIIKSAKKYAHKRGKSVSKIVQDYLASIAKVEPDAQEAKLGPLTQELHGMLRDKISADYRTEIADFIANKYK